LLIIPQTLEDEAIEHLRRDEIDAAIELYDEIASTYAESFIETENKKQKLSRKKSEKDRQSWYKVYIGAVLHNIGILHLLKFDFDKALYHFIRAAANRKSHFGAGNVDHLASLSKIAVCFYAKNDFEEAHKRLEEVLELSKNHLAGLTDFMQIAEILNNLGVLSFMCGQSEAAMTMFKECSEIQNAVLKQSLYGGPRLGGHATSLAISVTRGNVGYIRMLTKNAGAAIVEFESSLMHQQMILSDAHDTVICSMDHLAVAHLLAHNKEEATKMLSRMLRAQLDAYGPDDERCVLTLSKLHLVQTRKTDYLEKALEQLWSLHTSASVSSKSSKISTNAKSKNMLKKFSFGKKVAKLSH
jgi:tetratricopeptide (TPR) repeat protein